MNWQKINTAPKDGTLIDVWLGDASREDIDFYCDKGTKRSTAWCWKEDKFRPYVDSLCPPVFVEPTHWMPLPDEPSASKSN